MKSEKIDEIRKRFHKEWLLIAVDKVDKLSGTPLAGRLLAHSPDPMDIHKEALKSRETHLMTEYSDDWPEELAACFYATFFS